MKRLSLITVFLVCFALITHAAGTLTEVYINPNSGNDANPGSAIQPVATWNTALSLAASGATIYLSGSALTASGNINGSAYGASNITFKPSSAYTGALFAIAGGTTASFSNITFEGKGTAQNLISVNGNGTMAIGSGVKMGNGGRIALDGLAKPINLTATPAAGTVYPIVTTYANASDEGRTIVNTSVANADTYFDLVEPQTTATAEYTLVASGTNLTISELPVGDIYLDPLNGNDTNSGGAYTRAVKTVAKAINIWNTRNTATPGIDTVIYVCNQVNLTADMTLSGGLVFKNYTSYSGIMFYSDGFNMTFDDVTIKNTSSTAVKMLNGTTLTIKGNSKFYCSGSFVFDITGKSSAPYTINISNSTFYITWGTGISANHADVTLNSGTKINISSYGSALSLVGQSTMTINNGTEIEATGASNNSNILSLSCKLTMTGGTIKYTGSSTAGSLIYINPIQESSITGGTLDGGSKNALNIWFGYPVKLSNCTISSTNTTDGAIRASSGGGEGKICLDGTNTTINGHINLGLRSLIYVTTPTVTKNYTLMATDFPIYNNDRSYYKRLVSSEPKMDMSPYLNTNFSMGVPVDGHDLTAYAIRSGTLKDLVLCPSDGIYVNDVNGNDANTGAMPNVALKTLTTALTKTTPTKNKIYICDTTYTITNAQTLSPASPRDTILPFMIGSAGTSLINVKTGGSLTLGNIAVKGGSNINRVITINGGDVVMNQGASVIFQLYIPGITGNHGTFTMNNGAKLMNLINVYGDVAYASKNSDMTATLNAGSIIEKSQCGISCEAGVVNINGCTIKDGVDWGGGNGISVSYTGVVNMTAGTITNCAGAGFSISDGGTFNMSGGNIYSNNIAKYSATTSAENSISNYNITARKSTFNFTGGTLTASAANRNVISISSTATNKQAQMIINNSAVISAGFIYTNTPYAGNIPIVLSEQLSAAKIYNLNMGENMAGQTVVDGTTLSAPASVSNFVMNPAVTSLSLTQDGDNVIVGSGDIYLDGTSGNDANNGLTAATAVKTFKRAREVLYANPSKSTIKIINAATLANADEISDWDLSLRPDAKLQRATGNLKHLIYIPTGKTLSLTDIKISGFDSQGNGGDNDSYYGNSSSILMQINSTLNLGDGAVIDSATNFGIANQSFNHGTSTVYVNMTGGEIRGCKSAGIRAASINMSGGTIHDNYNGIQNLKGAFTMSGGVITKNTRFGINGCRGDGTTLLVDVNITGGTISENTQLGMMLNNLFRSAHISGLNVLKNGKQGDNTSGISVSSYVAAPVIFEIKNSKISENDGMGIYVNGTVDSVLIGNGCEITKNGGGGIHVQAGSQARQLGMEIHDCKITDNNWRGVSINGYYKTNIYGTTKIDNNVNIVTPGMGTTSGGGIYNASYLPLTISGNVSISGNKAGNGGAICNNNGIISISDGVTIREDTCLYSGAIYNTGTNSNITLKDIDIADCVIDGMNAVGSAITNNGKFTMTGGTISGCKLTEGRGTVNLLSGEVSLTGVKIENNTAAYASAITIGSPNLTLTMANDTIRNNTTTNMTYNSPYRTGAIHYDIGTFKLRDGCKIDDEIYLARTELKITTDESLMSGTVGAIKLLVNNPQAGRVVVTPNGTTVSDASQFIVQFTMANNDTPLGLDKGGTDGKEIILVYQYFIDGTKPDGGNGTNPSVAFDKIADLTNARLNRRYTTVWVSGPVTVTGNETILGITAQDVNIRRYNGFMVTGQLYPEYKGVLFTVNSGATLNIPGGNSMANILTIDGVHGAMNETNAAIFENNGTLNISGYTRIDDNPTQGVDAIVQNGTLNIHGYVDLSTDGSNTVYLDADKVITIDGALNTSITPIGVTVAPISYIGGRIVATGTTTNIPAGTESLFINQMRINPKYPIGRSVNGTTANLIFYVADRNVTDTPVYGTVQEAVDAANTNDEVRLFVNTDEKALFHNTIRYKSQTNRLGTMVLDSTAKVTTTDDLLLDNLFIRANTYGKKAQLNRNGFGISVRTNAYLDLGLPSNATPGWWYPVNLPFDASVSNVTDTLMNSIAYMDKFAVAEFSGQRRANYGIGNTSSNPNNDWKYLTGTDMTSGIGYMVGVDNNVSVLRFKASSLDLFKPGAAIQHYTGAAGASHAGINYVAQPIGCNATVASGIPNGSIIQASDDYSSELIGAASYVARTVGAATIIAPYTNYFYISGANDSVKYTSSTSAATIRSSELDDIKPAETPDYFEMRIYSDNTEHYDAFFAAASENASTKDYEIEHDVVKLGGTNSKLAQLWSEDFNTILCANEVSLKNGIADVPMYINLPEKDKEYHLNLASAPHNNQQLWLCRDGKQTQNLTEYPDFVIKGTGCTTNEYSLRITSSPTANETLGNVYVYGDNGKLVIAGLQEGDEYAIYNMSGQTVAIDKAHSNRISIYVGKGIFVVRINGIDYKAIIK